MSYPLTESAAFAALAWPALAQGAPIAPFHDVLADDDPGPHCGCPAHYYPAEATQLLADGHTAARTAEMGAGGRCPQQAHRLATGRFHRIYLKNVGCMVDGLRVIGRMEADGLRVMVDGDVNRTADGLLNTSACASATGEEINHQLTMQGELELRGQHAAPSSALEMAACAARMARLVSRSITRMPSKTRRAA